MYDYFDLIKTNLDIIETKIIEYYEKNKTKKAYFK